MSFNSKVKHFGIKKSSDDQNQQSFIQSNIKNQQSSNQISNANQPESSNSISQEIISTSIINYSSYHLNSLTQDSLKNSNSSNQNHPNNINPQSSNISNKIDMDIVNYKIELENRNFRKEGGFGRVYKRKEKIKKNIMLKKSWKKKKE